MKKKEEMIDQLQADISNFEALKERRDAEEITQGEFYATIRRGGFNNEEDFEATSDSHTHTHTTSDAAQTALKDS